MLPLAALIALRALAGRDRGYGSDVIAYILL